MADSKEKKERLLADFIQNRATLTERFKADSRPAIKALSPTLDAETVRRLLRSEADYPHNRFSDQTKKRLEWFLSGGQERDAYFNILRKMKLNPASVKTIDDDWGGRISILQVFCELRRQKRRKI